MRNFPRILALAFVWPAVVVAQNATVIGQVRVQGGGQPLGYSAISVFNPRRDILTGDAGRFLLMLPAGQARIRVKHLGYSPLDTVVSLTAGDTIRLTVSLPRLVIQLPAMLVSGKCENDTPLQPQPGVLADLFDQVNQNAERYRLLARSKEFALHVYRIRGYRNAKNKIVPTLIDTVIRSPFPASPYQPRNVMHRGDGDDAGRWMIAIPELPDFADTAFANNHCFRYAGQGRVDNDSVIRVEYEPVPWLDKEVDIKGTMILRASDFQLLATITALNKIPPQLRMTGMTELRVNAKFSEIVTGIPVLDEWLLTSRYRYPAAERVEMGQIFNIRFTDSTIVKTDTVIATAKRPRR